MNKDIASDIVVRSYNPFTQFDIVKEIWISLLKRCPHTYFLSWQWKDLWIKSLPPDCNITLIAGFRNESPVIAFFIGSTITTRHKFIPIQQLSINTTYLPHVDDLYFEYDGILVEPTVTIWLDLLVKQIQMKWDELVLPKCTLIYNPTLQLNGINSKYYNLHKRDSRSHYVDLDKVRSSSNYLSLLSPNKRSQIRRSIKEYEKIGKLRIIVAKNEHEVFEVFDELIDLHQKLWTGRGQPGNFSSEYFINFHKTLISQRFEHGEIQLMRISAGDYTIGCLYNLVFKGQVLFYTGGLDYLPNNIYRPGLVSHYLAIEHNAKIGLNSYDFLAGEDEYKRSLSTDYNEMQKTMVQKRNTKYYIGRIIARLNRLYKK